MLYQQMVVRFDYALPIEPRTTTRVTAQSKKKQKQSFSMRPLQCRSFSTDQHI